MGFVKGLTPVLKGTLPLVYAVTESHFHKIASKRCCSRVDKLVATILGLKT